MKALFQKAITVGSGDSFLMSKIQSFRKQATLRDGNVLKVAKMKMSVRKYRKSILKGTPDFYSSKDALRRNLTNLIDKEYREKIAHHPDDYINVSIQYL